MAVHWFCESCGGGNPTGTRFCGHCGTPAASSTSSPVVPAPAAPGARRSRQGTDERRLITALFADVSGFTVLGDRLELEELHDIIEPLIARLAAVGESFDGAVAKYAGDALLVFFGAPVAHEDHAARALLAAMEMHAELDRIRPSLGPEAAALEMHIGVNTGHAIAGLFGGEAAHYSILGDAVTTAQRLESVAPPGSTYVGAATVALTEHEFELEPMGELTLKGKAAPVPAWRLVGVVEPSVERPVVAGGAATGRRLVGRDGELRLLEDALAAASGESTLRVVALAGEAGVGKSRLTAATRDLAEGEDWRWFEARCPSYGAGLPYWPWAQLLRQVLDVPNGAGVEAVLAGLHRLGGDDLVTLASPYLARLLGVPLPPGFEAVDALEPEAFRLRLHAAVAACVERLGEEGPVVLAIDDLHWADASSLALAAHVAGACRSRPVVLHLTARPDGRAALQQVRAAAGEGGGIAVQLRPLDRAGVQAVVEDLLGAEAPSHLVDVIAARSAGNPFFVRETVRQLQDAGALVERAGHWRLRPGWDGGEVPATVEGVVAARIDLLPPATSSVLQAASVIGRNVLLPLLHDVMDRSVDVDAELVRLIDAGFLDRTAESDRLLFHHAIVSDVAYGRLLRRHRRDLHRRVADRAVARYGSGDDVVDLLARHLYLAEAGADAADVLLRAGSRARRLFANDEAVLHLARAAEVLRDTAGLAPRLHGVLLDLADLHDLVGDYEVAGTLYAEARDLGGDVRAWQGVAAMHRKQGDHDAALAVLDAAFAACRGRAGVLAPLWLERAWAMVVEDRNDEAVTAALSGLAAGPDDAVAGQLLLQLTQAEMGLGDVDAALSHALEAERLFLRHDDPRGLLTTMRVLGRVHAECRRLDPAAAALARGVELAERVGNGEELAGCLVNLGMVELQRGRLEEAVACDRRALAEVERIGYTNGQATASVNLAEKLLLAGQAEEALERCRHGLALAESVANTWVLADGHEVYARVLLAGEDAAGAAAAAQHAATLFVSLGRDEEALRCLDLAAGALELAGDADGAAALRRQAASGESTPA